MPSLKLFVLLAAFVVVSVSAQQRFNQPSYSPPAYNPPSYSPPSYSPPADYKPTYANGRVKMQVYRGPNKEYGKGYDTAFAPWGFYVTQPEDNKPYGRK